MMPTATDFAKDCRDEAKALKAQARELEVLAEILEGRIDGNLQKIDRRRRRTSHKLEAK